MKNKYYVYAYLDTRFKVTQCYDNLTFNYLPFYIGKGQRSRYLEHLNSAYKNFDKRGKDTNSLKCGTIRHIKEQTGDDPHIVILKHFDDEVLSLEYEKYLINLIGRRDLNTGPLTNLCEGGFGGSLTQTTKEKLSNINRGKLHPQYLHLNQLIIDKIIYLYEKEDYRIKEIASELNLDQNKVKKTLIENDVILKKRKPPLNCIHVTEIQRLTIKNLYEQNISIRDISRQLKLPFDKIRLIIKSLGLTRYMKFVRTDKHRENQSKSRKGKYLGKNNKRYISFTDDQIVELKYLKIDCQHTYKQIAERMGYSVSKIINELRKLGLVIWKKDMIS